MQDKRSKMKPWRSFLILKVITDYGYIQYIDIKLPSSWEFCHKIDTLQA